MSTVQFPMSPHIMSRTVRRSTGPQTACPPFEISCPKSNQVSCPRRPLTSHLPAQPCPDAGVMGNPPQAAGYLAGVQPVLLPALCPSTTKGHQDGFTRWCIGWKSRATSAMLLPKSSPWPQVPPRMGKCSARWMMWWPGSGVPRGFR